MVGCAILKILHEKNIGQDNCELFWTNNSFNDDLVPEFAKNAYINILPYIKEFLCAPHPFRKGIMCPFVPSALKNERIFFTYFQNPALRSSKKLISDCIDYINTKCQSNTFSALIILFPKDFDVKKLLKMQLKNKEQCVRRELMLGVLYESSQASSLHNSEYYPLRTPTPILVLRSLVASDLIFMDPKHYHLKKRLIFLESFINKFKSKNKSVLERAEVEKACQLRDQHKKKLKHRRIFYGMMLATLFILIYQIFYQSV